MNFMPLKIKPFLHGLKWHQSVIKPHFCQSLSKMALRTYAHISLQWKLMLMFLQQPQQALLLLLLCSCSNLITSRQVSCDKCAAHVCKSSCFEQWDRKSWPKGWPHWGQEVGQELYGLIAHSKTLFNKKRKKLEFVSMFISAKRAKTEGI